MSISNFEDQSYTEQQGPIQLSTQGAVSQGINYGTGYVQFAVSQNSDNGDYLRLTSASNPNASGAVSISGNTVYLGQGTSKIQIGTVDAVNDGLAGRPLKINFDNVTVAGTSPVTNGNFSQGLTGWTQVLSHVDLGVTQIAGWATPEAPVVGYPSRTPGGNDNDLLGGFNNPQVSVSADGRLLLQETSLTSTSFGVVHGPAAYSDPFNATAGMVLKFDWAANYVSDDYHVVGYLLNTATGATSIALQGYGRTGAGVASVAVPENGNFRFVFVSGSYDATGGQALGASMYIDNIRVEAGAVTDAVVQTLARQVVYENTSDNPAASKTVTVSTKNVTGQVSSDNLALAVTGINDVPVKTANVGLTNGTEDLAYTVTAASLVAGFSDPDQDTLSVTGLTASQGTVTANADGSFTIVQAPDFNGAVTLQYAIVDGKGGTIAATKSYLVAAVNDAPVTLADAASATEDGSAVAVDVLANDSDVDAGDTLTLVSVNAAGAVGAVSIVDGKVSYNPGAHFQSLAAGATATDTFTYTMKDSGGIQRNSTVTITVTGINDAPVALADAGNATEDGGAVVVDVLANDTDVDAGDTQTLVSVSANGTVGSVTIIDGKVSYDPGAHFQALGAGATATDTFTYVMKDGQGIERTATVTVTLTGVNDSAVALADAGNATEDGGAVLIDVLANDTDVDAGDTQTLVSVDATGAVGAVSIVNGKVSYNADAHFQSLGAGATATDTFSYTMKDSGGVESAAVVTMTINGVNDAPVAFADTASAHEDDAVIIDVLANDTDVDVDDTQTLVAVNAAGAVGAVSIVNGKVSYDAGAQFDSLGAGATAADTFTYTMKDSGGVERTATVTVNITGVNDAPVALADTGNATEDGSAIVIDVLANDTDVDAGDTKTLVSVNAAGAVGSVSVVNGKVSYDPGAHFQSLGAGATATDTFTYVMKDGGGIERSATVTVTITGVNDGPVALADAGDATEDGGAVVVDVLVNDTDVDAGDTQTLVSVDATGAVGSVNIVNGKVSYNADAHFQSLGAGATATDTFSYTMKDSSGVESAAVVTMTINGVNDAPVAFADTASAHEDDAVIIDVLANDSDVDAGDTQTLVAVNAAGTVGSVTVVNGKVSYDAATHFESLGAGATASDTFTYTMKDSGGIERTATVTMTITGVNDAPIALADAGNATEDGGAVVVDVLANDTDVDAGDTKTLVSVNATGAVGSVSIVNGKVSYDAGAHFQSLGTGATTTDTFSYTMKDGNGIERTSTVTMTITGVNDGPVALNDNASAQENQTIIIDVLANDTDVDAGDLKSIVSVDTASALGGSISISNGTVQYSADADIFDLLTQGESVTDTFTYVMKDASGATSSATATVKVVGVADGVSIYGTNQPDAGSKALKGTSLDEAIFGLNGNDEILGLAGADQLYGQNGDDLLDGGAGIDFLDGGNGDDVLIGGQGGDKLTGGLGNDVFVFNKASAGKDVDVITDFKKGVDSIKLLDGLSITGMNKVDFNNDGVFDTELVLNNGAIVELLGISGLASSAVLLA